MKSFDNQKLLELFLSLKDETMIKEVMDKIEQKKENLSITSSEKLELLNLEKESFVESVIENIESTEINSDLDSEATKITSLSKSELALIIREIKVLEIQDKQEEKISFYISEVYKNLKKMNGAYIGEFKFEKNIITPKIINKIIKMLHDKKIKTKFLQANLISMSFLIYSSDEKLKNSFNFSSDEDLYKITKDELTNTKNKITKLENNFKYQIFPVAFLSCSIIAMLLAFLIISIKKNN